MDAKQKNKILTRTKDPGPMCVRNPARSLLILKSHFNDQQNSSVHYKCSFSFENGKSRGCLRSWTANSGCHFAGYRSRTEISRKSNQTFSGCCYPTSQNKTVATTVLPISCGIIHQSEPHSKKANRFQEQLCRNSWHIELDKRFHTGRGFHSIKPSTNKKFWPLPEYKANNKSINWRKLRNNFKSGQIVVEAIFFIAVAIAVTSFFIVKYDKLNNSWNKELSQSWFH